MSLRAASAAAARSFDAMAIRASSASVTGAAGAAVASRFSQERAFSSSS